MSNIGDCGAVRRRVLHWDLAVRPLVLTTCSASKRCRVDLRIDALEPSDQPQMQAAWLATLGGEQNLTRADKLYVGRAFATARQAADQAGADLGILSAGLGYVRAETCIPSYDLTVRPSGPGSVPGRVRGPFDHAAWWRAVSGGPFSLTLEEDLQGRRLVMVCLSRSYAPMVADALASFAQSSGGALRIFGLSIERTLPSSLARFVMPYDERLGTVGANGTRVDFAQRALADFVRNALGAGTSLERHREAVERRLADAPRPAPRRRQRRACDDTLRENIRTAILAVGARRSDVLSHVRHVQEMSCEQGRFARLYDDVGGAAQS